MTYTIAPDGRSITCHVCERTSYHPEDVAQRYCGFCHRMHEDRRAGRLRLGVRVSGIMARRLRDRGADAQDSQA